MEEDGLAQDLSYDMSHKDLTLMMMSGLTRKKRNVDSIGLENMYCNGQRIPLFSLFDFCPHSPTPSSFQAWWASSTVFVADSKPLPFTV